MHRQVSGDHPGGTTFSRQSSPDVTQPRRKFGAGRALEKKEDEVKALTAEEWFGKYIPPTASVKEYSSAPPRGMTNPPQSAKVKRMLAEELGEYGVQFEGKVWPLKLPPKTRSLSLLTSKSPSRTTMSWCTPALLTLEEQRKGEPVFVERKPALIATKWQKAAAAEFGDSSIIKRAATAPSLGAKGEAKVKDKKKSAKAKAKAAAGNASSGNGASVSADGRRAAADSSKPGDEPWQPNRKVVPRTYDDTQTRNCMDALRSQGSLHRAGVEDRHRFGADLTAFGGMVLSGPGSTPAAPGVWASDASELISFHNKAIRLVNPSRLKELPKPARRRKKKPQSEEDESSVFVARYVPDLAPKNLRTLRHKAFPEKEDDNGPVAEELRACVASALKGFM